MLRTAGTRSSKEAHRTGHDTALLFESVDMLRPVSYCDAADEMVGSLIITTIHAMKPDIVCVDVKSATISMSQMPYRSVG